MGLIGRAMGGRVRRSYDTTPAPGARFEAGGPGGTRPLQTFAGPAASEPGTPARAAHGSFAPGLPFRAAIAWPKPPVLRDRGRDPGALGRRGHHRLQRGPCRAAAPAALRRLPSLDDALHHGQGPRRPGLSPPLVVPAVSPASPLAVRVRRSGHLWS